MPHSFATAFIPFKNSRTASVRTQLKAWGNPASNDLAACIRELGFVHFMSVNVIAGDDPERDAYIVLEISSDRDAVTTLSQLGVALHANFAELFAVAGLADEGEIGDYLIRHHRAIGQGWFARTLGLTFSGCPGMTVERIRSEADLARRIGDMTDILSGGKSPLAKLFAVRERLWAKSDSKWAFFADPIPWYQWQVLGPVGVFLRGGVPVIARLFGLLLVLLVAASAYVAWPRGPLSPLGQLGHILMFLVVFTAAIAAVGGPALAVLRAKERSDEPDDTTPGAARVGEVMARENHCAQNVLATVSEMKPGFLRHLALRVALATVGQLQGVLYRPGFLCDIGVIHFARWAVLRDKKGARLLFWSNYDGSLESYLEDFIQRAHEGVTAIWSNTVGFPRSRFLFIDGARDGDRLRRFVQRAQYPVLFWYSAYPDVTLIRIRINALIRRGVAEARTERAAADWLACFGSVPDGLSGTTALLAAKNSMFRRMESALGKRSAPDRRLEYDQIPALAFGGLPRLRFGTMLHIALKGSGSDKRSWLRQVSRRATYGIDERSCVVGIALAATALEKFGMPGADLATFPPVFRNGMMAEWRARALGDVGPNAPCHWAWGSDDKPVDVVLIVFAATQEELTACVVALRDGLPAGSTAGEIPMEPLEIRERGRAPRLREPFGFSDGVSQPVIRGTPRAQKSGRVGALVEPGEFILGYRDNLGYMPSTPTVTAANDGPGLLRRDADGIDAPRDFGLNGTFLVIRQLEQDPAAFEGWVAGSVQRAVGGKTGLGAQAGPVLESILSAKLVGRWPNGSALAVNPHAPGQGRGNHFTYGGFDPNGLACPLGAHIRRANPRDSFAPHSAAQTAITNRHRILRIGRRYAGAGGKVGLMFMCVNADIARQFEFIQQSWLLGPTFHGLDGETDPFVGCPARFTVMTGQGPLRLEGPARPLTRTIGGGYFFMPSRRALTYLAEAGWEHQPVSPTAGTAANSHSATR